MKSKKSNSTAVIAIFFATMMVIHIVSTVLFNIFPFPIKPTIVHIPVIIASIVYGPRIGASLGTLMGIMSIITNTLIVLPTSYLFSPFVPNGGLASIVIALLPRILIGIIPYYISRLSTSKTNLAIAGALGSLTNTIFVLGGIFLLFSAVFNGNILNLLKAVVATNSIAELLISATLTATIVPRLLILQKKK